MVYDLELGRMARSFDVFQGIRVHGIICCSSTSSTECAEGTLASSVAFEISVFGEGRVKMFSLQIETEQQVSVSFTLSQSSPKFANWVLDVSFFKIIVRKVASQYNAASLTNQVEDGIDQINSLSDSYQPHACQYEAVHIRKLVGHEGSIFRIAWSFDGTKLVSVSDDRSVWAACAETKHSEKPGDPIGLVLFGHSAQVWDCCILGLLIVTAGEDCTCRVWGLDGKHLQMIKEHTKSKYICCLHFACEDTLYVSTNHGYLYHARLLDTGEVEWTELVRLSDKVQIVWMDLFSEPLELCSIVEDWVAVGDGKGNVAIVGVICDACTPKVGFSLTWSAGME